MISIGSLSGKVTTWTGHLADDLVRSPDKLATENIFILTVEMHKKVAARSFIFTWVLSYIVFDTTSTKMYILYLSLAEPQRLPVIG